MAFIEYFFKFRWCLVTDAFAGFEAEPRLPASLAPALYDIILNNNLNPAKVKLTTVMLFCTSQTLTSQHAECACT